MILAWLASFECPDKCKPKQEEMSGNAEIALIHRCLYTYPDVNRYQDFVPT
jgi:hypothetical protein